MTPPPKPALPRLLAAFAFAAILAYPLPLFASAANDALAPEEADEGPAGPASPAEPAVPPQAEACIGQACPSSAADWIFFRYGKDCAGVDWKFLRSAAKAQGGLDPQACAGNLAPFLSFLTCAQPPDPEADARRMNAFIEARVREALDHYYWLHKRFKTRPAGERSPYE